MNAELAALKVSEASPGADTIALSATDSLGETGTPAHITLSTGTKLTPVLTAPATLAAGTGLSTPVTGVTLSETGSTSGEIFTVKLTDTNGVLSATGTGVAGSGSKAVTISGTLAQVNADLATLSDTDAVAGAG